MTEPIQSPSTPSPYLNSPGVYTDSSSDEDVSAHNNTRIITRLPPKKSSKDLTVIFKKNIPESPQKKEDDDGLGRENKI